MTYGCIGKTLKHSFSKIIHNLLNSYDYTLTELSEEEVGNFMKRAEFNAINVTIPYKETVIPYLYSIDENAKAIGSVNTVVNRGGLLFGYNTDFFGMSMLIKKAGISLLGKKVLILGTGGTSKTAYAVSISEGAKEVIKASRNAKCGALLYTDVYKLHSDAEIIINTTPVGMYPDISSSPIDISKFPNLSGVIDAIYNPLSTPLILSAKERNIPAIGGLYMLVAQGVRASEIFLNTTYPKSKIDEIYDKILSEKQNIVLIGMPSSGKSTVGKIIAELTSREYIDTDDMIKDVTGVQINEIFRLNGEKHFRDLETEAILSASAKSGVVIATGGGVPLKYENIFALRENGIIYFIDRPLENLIPTSDRPTASTKDAIKKRYDERYGIYLESADYVISADVSSEEVAQKIISAHF